MKVSTTGFIARVMVVFFAFIIINAVYQGIITKPTELDSLYYHIPIAKSYLDGRIFSSPQSPILHRYFPGASEGILALFILFRIPLNLYNVLALMCLFAACLFLGRRAGLPRDQSVIYAAALSTLTGIIRWANVQVIDIWMAVWYAGALALLLKPQRRWQYALCLGALLGMIIGTKYSGPALVFFLLVIFPWRLNAKLRPHHYVLLAAPVLVLGGFWYLRNFLVKGNPLYPLAFLSFPGVKGWALEEPVWKAFIDRPYSFGSALLSEFFAWPLIILAGYGITVKRLIRKTKINREIVLLYALSLLNLAVYIFLPNGQGYTVHVSNLRYSYPVLVPAVLATFLLAQSMKKADLLTLSVFFQAFFSLQVTYHPKLLIVWIPAIFFIWYRTDKLER